MDNAKSLLKQDIITYYRKQDISLSIAERRILMYYWYTAWERNRLFWQNTKSASTL